MINDSRHSRNFFAKNGIFKQIAQDLQRFKISRLEVQDLTLYILQKQVLLFKHYAFLQTQNEY
ncbi:MAG: hypothetical protein CMF36_11490 [Leeuwenhoekiella sp.]|nr:hypothetical protein [Leeuwenhoekiella sp.]MBA81744.1 hypothetical protein [Leeuwenhoekiella sp.]